MEALLRRLALAHMQQIETMAALAGQPEPEARSYTATSLAHTQPESWRSLLVEADSMLSAYGYGRAVTKDEAIELSARCRKAYEGVIP